MLLFPEFVLLWVIEMLFCLQAENIVEIYYQDRVKPMIRNIGKFVTYLSLYS